MTITGGSGLPKDDIERMMREAEQYAEEDRSRRETVETRNTADSLVYQTEKFIADNEDKLPADAKTEVQESIAEVKKTLEGEDSAAIKTATDNLARTSQKLGAALYANVQGGGDGGDGPTFDGPSDSGTSTGSTEDDVVDAEIVDEDGENRSK